MPSPDHEPDGGAGSSNAAEPTRPLPHDIGEAPTLVGGADPPPGDSLIGRLTHLGRYALVSVVGRGGMGTVYKATDPDLQRTVALKVLRDSEADAEQVRRLYREAAVAAQLSHPGIVPIHEVGASQTTPDAPPQHYIVMGLIEGPTLEKAMGKMPLGDRIDVMLQIAEAVGHAHTLGVVHRDLKPANILLTGEGRAMVTDFGIARWEGSHERLTSTGAVFGTAPYMAPEQVAGQGDLIDARTDVWALGVMLYELICGARPFRGASGLEVHQAILQADPPTPVGRDEELPSDLKTICLKALEKDRALRYADGHALRDDLRRLRAGEPILARPPTLLYYLRKWIRRHPALCGLTLMALAVLLGIAGWTRTELRRQALESEKALERSRRERAERRQQLLRELQPLERKLERTRLLFYVEHVDIRAQLDRLAEDLERLSDQAATRAQTDHPELWTLLGVGWYVAGRTARAERALLRAARLSGGGRAHYYLGRIYLERALLAILLTGGDIQAGVARSRNWSNKALRFLKQPVKGWREEGEIAHDVALGYRALAARRPEEVLRRCNAGLRKYGRQIGAEAFWALLGWIRKGPQRLTAWNKALQWRPHNAWLRLARGNLHFQQKRPEQALADYAAALTVRPRMHQLHNNRGVVLMGLRRYPQALASFDAAIQLAPEQASYYNNRAQAHVALRRLPDALADFERCLKRAPRHVSAYHARGSLRLKTGALDDAERDFRTGLSLAPDDARLHNGLGTVLAKRGALKAAEACFDQAIASDRAYAGAWANRGLMHMRQGQAGLALRDCNQALELDPTHPQAYHNRGNVYLLLLRRYAQARDDFKHAVRLRPNWAAPFVDLGTTHGLLGDHTAALAALDRAIALDQTVARAYSNRAFLRHTRNLWPAALRDYDRALALKPDDPDVLFKRGITLRKLGQLERALADHQRATRLRPDYWQGWYQLALGLQALKRAAQARQAMETARQKAPAAGKRLIDEWVAAQRPR